MKAFIAIPGIRKKNYSVLNKNKTIRLCAESVEEKDEFSIPGKMILAADVIKERKLKLKALSDLWKNDRILKEEFAKQTFGFNKNSEILNGRMAMFFIVTGLLTEVWTGQTVPGQIETILRTLGIL